MAEGTFNNMNYKVVGQVTYDCGDGFYDDFLLDFGSGVEGWLEFDEGVYSLWDHEGKVLGKEVPRDLQCGECRGSMKATDSLDAFVCTRCGKKLSAGKVVYFGERKAKVLEVYSVNVVKSSVSNIAAGSRMVYFDSVDEKGEILSAESYNPGELEYSIGKRALPSQFKWAYELADKDYLDEGDDGPSVGGGKGPGMGAILILLVLGVCVASALLGGIGGDDGDEETWSTETINLSCACINDCIAQSGLGVLPNGSVGKIYNASCSVQKGDAYSYCIGNKNEYCTGCNVNCKKQNDSFLVALPVRTTGSRSYGSGSSGGK